MGSFKTKIRANVIGRTQKFSIFLLLLCMYTGVCFISGTLIKNTVNLTNLKVDLACF